MYIILVNYQQTAVNHNKQKKSGFVFPILAVSLPLALSLRHFAFLRLYYSDTGGHGVIVFR